jgi:hypothetical protein
MELKKNLLKKEKSGFRISVGVISILLSILWIGNRIISDLDIRPFDWLYSVFFALIGVVHLIEGYGTSAEKLFGSAFVLIDNERISIKPRILTKGQNIYWESIKRLDYKFNTFRIQKVDNTIMTLDLSKFDYVLKNDIKNTIATIAKDKNIQTRDL